MDNKYQTLQTIYELVKNDPNPTATALLPNEIILNQNLPWNEIVNHLNELKSDHLIEILQHSPVIIYITVKGFQYILSARSNPGNFMYAA